VRRFKEFITEDVNPHFDTKTVSDGSKLYYKAKILHVNPRTLIRAHDKTNPNFANYQKVDRVKAHVAQGGRLSMPEVGHQKHGQVGFTNGRNRTKWAAEQGHRTIPIAVHPKEAKPLLQTLAKHAHPDD
jgi:hypothetical protein